MLSVLRISLLAASCALFGSKHLSHNLTWRGHEPPLEPVKQPEISNNLDPSNPQCHGKKKHPRIFEDATQMAAGFMGSIVQSVITSNFATGVKEIAGVSRIGISNETSNGCMLAKETYICKLKHAKWFIGELSYTDGF
ncbi:uncharacterized protein EAF01_008639 [Botrytis porri]|uniref:uncharacterized protein n=1 Tax=Botrytis porri TaxID=87229 RepID=UPI0019019F79|nr:uncharacterized protein EAF01_008639 [Botrytis porri]KAF7897673.1 hypothetical protein EAF01_008639 [Botrytis porri]